MTDDEEESERNRMVTNVIIVVFVVALAGAGFWLADAMFTLRKNQDCVLAGRKNCAGVSVPAGDRW
jgi:hypothetical protein